MGLSRLQVIINGQIQGVGFRPHVYRIAQKLQLTGWVQNNSEGVLIEVQGLATSLFIETLLSSLPSLAKVDRIESTHKTLIHDETDFQIIASQSGLSRTMISPDVGPCNDCLKELFDPQSRYYRYPFLNCTQCGPRLTITYNVPYDRHQTAMNEFPLCHVCQRDYANPENRRYHAQPTACSACGPQLSSSIQDIVLALRKGQIVALKGIGGYQLLCDATNEKAILTLRQRKNREAKPFALMVANTQSADMLVEVSHQEKELLNSSSRPIVLLKKKSMVLPDSIAPQLNYLGIMLPSSPLHYLLFNELSGSPDGVAWLKQALPFVLVATSANRGGHPLIIEDEAAQKELTPIADLIVSYNRKIIARVDDSVIRVTNHKPVFIRRARGYSPQSIPLAKEIPSTLALGGHLKNTFCITRGKEAFVSQHIGSLTNKATIEFFHESLESWIRLLDVKIERIACDLHPNFYTSKLAHELNLPVVAVQHHHAHLAAVAAEHHISGPVLGLALDGYGYGQDGSAWGGELMLLEKNNVQRLGCLHPIPQPGGEKAVLEPWRMAVSILHVLGNTAQFTPLLTDSVTLSNLNTLLKSKMPLPMTSSCGRLFDAASALLGVNTYSKFEGQAAMQLESLASKTVALPHGWSINTSGLNILPVFNHLLHTQPEQGANLFHGTLITGLLEWILHWSAILSIRMILLSGGCFLNKILTEELVNQLTHHGIHAYLPQHLPPNDGGISLGQAWIAGNSHLKGISCA